MNNEEKALKECPFCGNSITVLHDERDSNRIKICCEHCGVSMGFDDKDYLIIKWNSRDREYKLYKEINELRSIISKIKRISGGVKHA